MECSPPDSGAVSGSTSRHRSPGDQLGAPDHDPAVEGLTRWIEARAHAARRAQRWWYLSCGRELDGCAYVYACVRVGDQIVAVRQVVGFEDGTWHRYAYDEIVVDPRGGLTDQPFVEADVDGVGDHVLPITPESFARTWALAEDPAKTI